MPFGANSRYLGQFEPKLSELGNDQDLWWVVPFSVRYVVGIAGNRFAGSSTALSFLGEKLGFRLYSLSDELRRIARAQGVPLDSRERLQDLGDELRAENEDGGYLARLALQRIRADLLRWPRSRARIAVGGFKHPDEVRVFEELQAFHFLCLKVGARLRYKRALESGVLSVELETASAGGGEAPPIGRARFKREIDDRDRDGRGLHDWTGEYGQWVDGVMELGKQHTTLLNGGDVDRGSLFAKLTEWVSELDGRYQRPEL
jgi:hypothetical protein